MSTTIPGLKKRHAYPHHSETQNLLRVSRGPKRKRAEARIAGFARSVFISVLGISSLSLWVSLWWLFPSIAQDAEVHRNTLGMPKKHVRPKVQQLQILTDPRHDASDSPQNQHPFPADPLSAGPSATKGSNLSASASVVGEGYRTQEQMSARSGRFPSVDERVQVYMTNWYLPPCDKHAFDDVVEYNFIQQQQNDANMMIFREARTTGEKKRAKLRTFLVDDTTEFDLLRYMNRENMLQCNNTYCTDTVKYLFPAMDRALAAANNEETKESVASPVLYQFSDAEKTHAYIPARSTHGPHPNVPHLKKFRSALSKAERDRVVSSSKHCATTPREVPVTILQQQQQLQENTKNIIPTAQPVIFKLTILRHFGPVQAVPEQDQPWSEKKDQAIFRGQFTGGFPKELDIHDIKQLPVIDQCQLLRRCRLVYNSAANTTAPLVDAKLAFPVLEIRKDFPKTINGIDLYGDRVSIEDMLTYKAIIMLEGNDVSSGLKWALYSNSVVMTQTPTLTSWAMEELLEPWVHYIPLADDLSDVEEKMQWVIDNDKEAQHIAHRGKLWISDLVFHPDAESDDQQIFDEIVRRYKAHFVRNPSLQLSSTEKQ